MNATTVPLPVPQSSSARARVLCVDDEPAVLEGLALHLRRRYEVASATSGAAALEILDADPSIAVVVSDMRMPQMDGAAFLARARVSAPAAVRVLLTGQTDLGSAIAAVNDGQIFRFLTKPCPPDALLAVIASAAEQNRLVRAERELLEQTVRGSIRALTDVLALTCPAWFGRANRIQEHVRQIASRLGLVETWQVETAAMLSGIGGVILPQETVERIHRRESLSADEAAMVARVPAVTSQILASIPRLEDVRAILALQSTPFERASARATDPESARILRGAQILTVATDFDELVTHGSDVALAVATLRGREQRYDPLVIDALAATCGSPARNGAVREITVAELRVGMSLADDVKLKTGALVVAHGFVVTPSFLERLRNFGPAVREPLRVAVRG